MEATVDVDPKLSASVPGVVYEEDFVNVGGPSYGVAPDGNRFLVIDGWQRTTTTLRVVLGWSRMPESPNPLVELESAVFPKWAFPSSRFPSQRPNWPPMRAGVRLVRIGASLRGPVHSRCPKTGERERLWISKSRCHGQRLPG